MLSKESYEVLQNAPEKIYDIEQIHRDLCKSGELKTKADKDMRIYCYVTDAGRAAVEEYERSARDEHRDDKALVRSTWANIISALALAVSIAALVVSVVK